LLFLKFIRIKTRNSGCFRFCNNGRDFYAHPTIFRFTLTMEELKTPMTDNLKVKAGKTVDDARVAAHAAYDDAAVAAHNAIKGAGAEAQKMSDKVKTGVHKAVADAKITAHEAGSKLKKR
jgi:hypothetical protein